MAAAAAVAAMAAVTAAAKATAKATAMAMAKHEEKDNYSGKGAAEGSAIIIFFTRHPFSAIGGSNISLNQDTNIIIT